MYSMYVIVRNDIPKSYQAVQGGHAAAQFMLKHNEVAKLWNNHRLIYVNVKDERALRKMIYKLRRHNLDYASFNEPDINNEMTAIATVVTEKERKLFKHLSLV